MKPPIGQDLFNYSSKICPLESQHSLLIAVVYESFNYTSCSLNLSPWVVYQNKRQSPFFTISSKWRNIENQIYAGIYCIIWSILHSIDFENNFDNSLLTPMQRWRVKTTRSMPTDPNSNTSKREVNSQFNGGRRMFSITSHSLNPDPSISSGRSPSICR